MTSNKFKVSVAMATYNGHKYIKEQLESIFYQTMPPDELVICDDASSDDTVDYIKSIIRDNAPEHINIRIYTNAENLGYARNFEQCISLATGDIVFLSDQDDIWEKIKIETILKAFELDNEATLVFSNSSVIDEFGNIIDNNLNKWDTRNDKSNVFELQKLIIMRKGLPYGHTIAIKRDLYEKCMPFPETYAHDGWLPLCAPLYGNVITLDEKLVRYRRHSTNSSGHRPSVKERLKTWDRYTWFTYSSMIQNAWSIFIDRYENLIDSEVRMTIEESLSFLQICEFITKNSGFIDTIKGGGELLRAYHQGTYRKHRGTRNTLILDEVYLLLHIGK